MELNRTKTRQQAFDGTASEKIVLSCINDGVTAQEELTEATALDSKLLASTLTMLEIEGLIRPVGDGNWILA